MSGRTFSLTDRLNRFVDQQVADGHHQDANEVVREALRRYQEDLDAERASLAAIEAVAERGIADVERGAFRLVDGAAGQKALLDSLNHRLESRARNRALNRNGRA